MAQTAGDIRPSDRARDLLSQQDVLSADQFRELDQVLRDLSFIEFTALTNNPAYQAQLRAYQSFAGSISRWLPLAAGTAGFAALTTVATLLLLR